MKRPLLSILTIFCISVFPHNKSFAQSSTTNDSDNWEITIAPYMLFGSLSGEATVGITGPTEVNADFGDLLKNLQFAFMIHGEAQKGKWGLITDYLYMKLGSDISTPTGGILDAEVKESILEVFANHRIRKDWGWIDIYGGIRWWDIDLNLELEGIVSGEGNKNESWVDPVIGGRIYYKSDRLLAGLRMDIGGFGLGSDFSYNIQPGIGYQFSDTFTLMLQYKLLDVDYNNGEEGRETFAMNTSTYGPLLGFVLQF